MLPEPPIPLPGRYRDSSGTAYDASLRPRLGGWFLRRTGPGLPAASAFFYPDFARAVARGMFQPDPL